MKIIYENELYAVVIKSNYKSDKEIDFLTEYHNLFQVGFLTRNKGHQAHLHSHNAFNEPIHSISEYIRVEFGKVKIDLYSEELKLITEVILNKGDFIIHLQGLHEVTFLEKSRIFEIKQGPYHGAESKTFYEKMGNTKN